MTRHASTIRNLQTADAVECTEFYVTFTQQSVPSFGVRLWDSLTQMTPEAARDFVKQLNEATLQVRLNVSRRYRDAAASDLLGGRDLTK